MPVYRSSVGYDDTAEDFYFVHYDPDPNGPEIQPSTSWFMIDTSQPPPPQNLWPTPGDQAWIARLAEHKRPILGAGITFRDRRDEGFSL